jgi:recombination endonuclease VII
MSDSDSNNYFLARKRRLLDAGLCLQCGDSDSILGQKLCESCKNKNRALINSRTDAGLCMTGCGRPLEAARKCAECRASSSKKALDRRAEFIKNGLCGRCGKRSLINTSRCIECYSDDRDKKFGLPLGTFKEMYAYVDKCQACGEQISLFNPKKWMTPHLDHDHGTGKVRGLICRGCNSSIGFMSENPNRLRLLAEYLEKHKSTD